jgi:hypothetical protein
MKRNYESGVSESADFFVGTEVEHTPMHGERTLFVVGVQSADAIVQMASGLDVKHIYFGANMSFPMIHTNDADQWQKWESMIKTCLDAGFWCTLDIDVAQVEGLCEGGLTENRRFIPMISVKLPYVQLLNFNMNATVKIDDKDFAASNPGVWCHSLHDLMDRSKFTNWDAYTKDEIIK